MARGSRTKNETVSLSPQHIARMEREAPAALARRSGGWMFEQMVGTFELLLVATLSLAALWLWDASPLSMLMVLLATAWLGILGEIAKYVLLRRAVEAEVREASNDQFVWHVVTALMLGRARLSRDAVQGHSPGLGIFIDLVCGSVGTAGLLAMLHQAGADWRGALAGDPVARWTLLAIAAWQVLGIGWMAVRHAWLHSDPSPPKFAAGGRGLGLFVLVFILLMAGNEGRDLHTALGWVYGLLLALCLLSAPGYWLMQREIRWLQGYLARRTSGVTSHEAIAAGNGGKRVAMLP